MLVTLDRMRDDESRYGVNRGVLKGGTQNGINDGPKASCDCAEDDDWPLGWSVCTNSKDERSNVIDDTNKASSGDRGQSSNQRNSAICALGDTFTSGNEDG